MKLLFAIKKLEEMAGGAERVLCIVASELARRGHEVAVLTFDRSDGESFYDLDPQIERIDLGVGDSARPARVVETLRRVRSLRRAVRNHAPDVAIGFNPSIYVPMGLALIGTGIPLVGSEHAVPDGYRKKPVQTVMTLLSAPLMRRVTVLSETIRRRYPAALRNKMVAVTNPVDPVSRDLAESPPEKTNVIVNVGRMTEQKDQETLLRAFALVAPDFPDWCLKIWGDGPLRSQLEALIQDLALAGQVEMPGLTRDIHNEYAGARIFALSSRWESLGLVAIEAMQHGVATVGFADCPGANEFLVHQDNALLAGNDPSREEAFADQLRRLMTDSDYRRDIGARGQQSIAGSYDSQAVCDQWEGLLREVVVVSE